METGYYKKRLLDWEQWEVDLFEPSLFNCTAAWGCGANTLALLTGVPPNFIRNTNRKNPNHWKDSFMVNFLKNHGFRVHHLTKCDVSNTDPATGFASANITDRHILLMSQLMNKNTASWSVGHNKLWYHNFEICSFPAISLLNQPTLTCYLVVHPKWRSENWLT